MTCTVYSEQFPTGQKVQQEETTTHDKETMTHDAMSTQRHPSQGNHDTFGARLRKEPSEGKGTGVVVSTCVETCVNFR